MLHLTQAGESHTDIEDICVCARVCVCRRMYIFLSKMCPKISVKNFYTFAFEARQWGLRGGEGGCFPWHEQTALSQRGCSRPQSSRCLYYTLTLQATGSASDGYLPKAVNFKASILILHGCKSGFCSTCP